MKKNIFRISLLLFNLILIFESLQSQSNSFSKSVEIKKDIKKYSTIRDKIVSSFLNIYPEYIVYPNNPKSEKWNYEQGLILDALRQIWLTTGEMKYYNYIRKNLDKYISDDGSIKTYELEEFNIDNIPPGKTLIFLYKTTGLEKYKKAFMLLRRQLEEHPRTNEGGFWHKKIYPYQMWLDGLYMGEPFYAMYSSFYNDTKAFDDITNQFLFMYKHAYDKKSGLLYHGWDESKKMKWANVTTGASPNFWGRAMGWYMMALVDVLDFLPEKHSGYREILKIFKTLSGSLIKYRDKRTGLWFQVLDKGDKKGNYIEASASCMFTYAFAKGVNRGYLNPEFGTIARLSFDNILRYLTEEDKNGNINLLHVCQVSGLGGTPYRDGSFEYYIGEPQRTNDFKGYGPFMLAANELAKLEDKELLIGERKVVGLDYHYNKEVKDGRQFHYIWEDTTFGGFFEFGKIFECFGAKLEKITSAPSLQKLKKIGVYIIVDPDTPKETDKPNYLQEKEIDVIEKWVINGGVLVLMANDSGNCEFKNFNKLAEKFGIKFNEDSKNKVKGQNFEMGAFDDLSACALFKNVKKIYMKEISTINITYPAKALFSNNGSVIIAESRYGKGYVIAVGDPWLYNEYIDNRKLPVGFENYLAGINFTKFILKKSGRLY